MLPHPSGRLVAHRLTRFAHSAQSDGVSSLALRPTRIKLMDAPSQVQMFCGNCAPPPGVRPPPPPPPTPPTIITSHFRNFSAISFFMEEEGRAASCGCAAQELSSRVRRRSLAALNETCRSAVGNTFDGIPCSLLWLFKVKRMHRFIHRFSPSTFASCCGSSLILNSTGNCGRSPCSRFPDVRYPVPTS